MNNAPNGDDVTRTPDRETLRDTLAELLGLPAREISDDANLASLGLKSLQLMQLVNGWRRDGLAVSFRELSACPTIEDWAKRLAEAGQA